ncbi:MAG: hypothetical protein ACRERW_13710, partial [Pseudomonas sp.]
MKQGRVWALMLMVVILTGCATAPPRDQNNLCNIFREYPDWYE